MNDSGTTLEIEQPSGQVAVRRATRWASSTGLTPPTESQPVILQSVLSPGSGLPLTPLTGGASPSPRDSFARSFRIDPVGTVRRLSFDVLLRHVEAEEATRVLLPYLLKASPAQRNLVFNALMDVSSPQDILYAALSLYEEGGDHRFLKLAADLLGHYDAGAWPALLRLAQSARPEAVYFVKTILRLEGVSHEHRKQALVALGQCPDPETRRELMEQADWADPEDAEFAWRILATDTAGEIRAVAQDRLGFPSR